MRGRLDTLARSCPEHAGACDLGSGVPVAVSHIASVAFGDEEFAVHPVRSDVGMVSIRPPDGGSPSDSARPATDAG